MYIQINEIHKQKLAWLVGYLDLYANRNMFKKHILASPTVSFSARTFKTFVNYLNDKQIQHFDQHIYLWVFEKEAKIKIIFPIFSL